MDLNDCDRWGMYLFRFITLKFLKKRWSIQITFFFIVNQQPKAIVLSFTQTQTLA